MKTVHLNKNWIYLIALCLLNYSFNSCKISEPKVVSSTINFEEIHRKIDTLSASDEDIKFAITFEDTELFLSIHLETEACILTAWGKDIPTELNYTYDMDLESSLDRIKILQPTVGNDLILLLPTYTEEFLTCQVLLIGKDRQTYKTGLFEIDTHNYKNVPEFYLSNKMKLELNKDHYKATLDDFTYEQSFSDEEN